MTLQVATCVSSRRVSFMLLVLLSVLVVITYSCYIAFIILPDNTPSSNSHDDDENSSNADSNSSSNDTNNNSSNNLTSEYNPEVAWRGLHYCKAAYCPTEKLIDWSCGETCDEVKFFEPCFLYLNASYGTLGFAGLDHIHHKIVLAFRGSSNTANWIENLNYWAMPYPSESCGSECMVHRGFYRSYVSLQPYVLMDMADLHMQYPSYTLLVTGHSLGAALALFSALDLATWDDMEIEARLEHFAKMNFINNKNHELSSSDYDDDDVDFVKNVSLRNTLHTTRSHITMYNDKNKKYSGSNNDNNSYYTLSDVYVAQNKGKRSNNTTKTKNKAQIREINTSRALAPIEVYTFGEPRVGDAHFSLWSTSVLSVHQQFRVTHGRDVVPHLPPQSSNYIHVPQELWYNNSYEQDIRDDNYDEISQSNNNDHHHQHDINSNKSSKNGLTMMHVKDRNKNDILERNAATHNSNHSTLSYRICTDNATSEDYNCSNSVWSTSVSDHLLYLGVCTRCECTSKDIAEIESYQLSDEMLEKLYNMHEMGTGAQVSDKLQETSATELLEEQEESKTQLSNSNDSNTEIN